MSRGKEERDEDSSGLREMILSELVSEEIDGKREFTVMTRLSGEYVEILDALAKLKVFKSRSEAAAALIMKTVLSELELYKGLKDQADRLDDLQDTVKDLALKALRD